MTRWGYWCLRCVFLLKAPYYFRLVEYPPFLDRSEQTVLWIDPEVGLHAHCCYRDPKCCPFYRWVDEDANGSRKFCTTLVFRSYPELHWWALPKVADMKPKCTEVMGEGASDKNGYNLHHCSYLSVVECEVLLFVFIAKGWIARPLSALSWCFLQCLYWLAIQVDIHRFLDYLFSFLSGWEGPAQRIVKTPAIFYLTLLRLVQEHFYSEQVNFLCAPGSYFIYIGWVWGRRRLIRSVPPILFPWAFPVDWDAYPLTQWRKWEDDKAKRRGFSALVAFIFLFSVKFTRNVFLLSIWFLKN